MITKEQQKKIKKAMIDRSIDQKTIAKKINRSVGSVSMFMNGLSEGPTIRQQISELLKIKI